MPDTVRIDKWLWAVRFFKTRSLAAKECSAGKIKRGNKSLKPSAQLQLGDHLEIPATDGTHKRHIEVTGLLEKRVSAPLARERIAAKVSARAVRLPVALFSGSRSSSMAQSSSPIAPANPSLNHLPSTSTRASPSAVVRVMSSFPQTAPALR